MVIDSYCTLGSDVNSIPTAIFNNSGTWMLSTAEAGNIDFTHPITRTIGGYTFQALPTKDTTTHTLLTNPTTHYRASDIGILPNNPNTWIPYSSTITKTIYDPCPYGYRVPINGSWAGWSGNPKWTTYVITGGLSWPAKDGGWWPAAGSRSSNSTILYNIGDGGGYWSSSRYSAVHTTYNLGFNYNSWVNPSTSHTRSNGYSVRCIEEKGIISASLIVVLQVLSVSHSITVLPVRRFIRYAFVAEYSPCRVALRPRRKAFRYAHTFGA